MRPEVRFCPGTEVLTYALEIARNARVVMPKEESHPLAAVSIVCPVEHDLDGEGRGETGELAGDLAPDGHRLCVRRPSCAFAGIIFCQLDDSVVGVGVALEREVRSAV